MSIVGALLIRIERCTKAWLLCQTILLALLVSPAAAEKRVALVIGNGSYVHAPELPNPPHDAVDMAAVLRQIGFVVIEGESLDKITFEKKVREFAASLDGADVGVFFYSGHGLQVNGVNYLVPTDAELSTAAALEFEMVRLDTVQRLMELATKTNILFLDACRNNPLARNLARALGTRSGGIARGLAPAESGTGTLIAYSTQPGNVALDGEGRNSPFTGPLIKRIATKGEDILTTLTAVRRDVIAATRQNQVPWDTNALTDRFYFNPTLTDGMAGAVAQPPMSEAAVAWGLVKDTTTPAALEAYVRQFPDTIYAELARQALKKLKSSQIADIAKSEHRVADPPRGDVTMYDIINDATTTFDVVSNGLGPQGQRYSPLRAVNTETVSGLVPAWAFSFGGEKQRGQQAQPLVRDGVMYVTASYSRIYAVDTRTGDKLWEYNHRLPEGILPCCDVVNRGAALYANKVYFGTLDAKLVALDAKTGKVVWIKTIDDFKGGYSYTAAPLIVPSKAHGPLLVTGMAGAKFGIAGRVEARKVSDGEMVWSRPTIEGHMGTLNGKDSTITGKVNESWPGDLWKTGGGATWLGGTYDPDTNLIIFGTGSPAPWNSHMRPGDNKWSSSRLALDPETGEIKWGFQTTPYDGWAYDGVNEVIPFEAGGKKLAATADRNGFFYVLDRTNGKFVSAVPFVSKISWAKGIDKNGRPIYVSENRPGDPSKSVDGKKGTPVFAVPSWLGAKNQQPMAYSKDTGLFYVPSNEWGMDLWNEPVTYKRGAAYLGAGFTVKAIFNDHVGSLKAIEPLTGKIRWEYKNKAVLWGGVLATGGGLVFFGTPEGDLKALDASTGKELWRFNTGSGVIAPPITWEQDGEQFVAVVSGWGGAVPLWGGEIARSLAHLRQGGMVWAFRLKP